MHVLEALSVRSPGLQAVHVADPALLKPLSHCSQLSLAPRLYVFSGHSSSPVRLVAGLCPAVAVEQYTAASSDVYSPGPSHGSHLAPSEEKLPGVHAMHVSEELSVRCHPGLHVLHVDDPGAQNELTSQGVQVSLAP